MLIKSTQKKFLLNIQVKYLNFVKNFKDQIVFYSLKEVVNSDICNNQELIDLSCRLLKLKTDSPGLCMPALQIISQFLSELGFICSFVESKEGNPNLICCYSNGGHHICFAGHVDVVPAGQPEQWKFNPFEPTIADKSLFARGTSDMKCSIACFLLAIKTFIKTSSIVRGSISVLITSDEETLSNGAHAITEKIVNKKIDLIIIGEPTSNSIIGDNVTKFRHGSANFHISILGKQSHVAFIDSCNNPNTTIIKILNELISTDWGEEELKTKSEITLLKSPNLAPNIVPNESSARINFRFSYHHSISKISLLVSNACKKFSREGEYQIQYDNTAQPCKYRTSHLEKYIISAIEKVTKRPPKISGCMSVSDGYIFSNLAPIIEIGALKNQAHKINEQITISDLQSLYLIYLQSIKNIYSK